MTAGDVDADFLRTLTVLYVEDDADAGEEINAFLRRRVGKLVTAAQGAEGLAAFRSVNPDLIVTDIQMPRLNGFDLCRALKADPRTAGIPVIITSALASQPEIDRGLAAGAIAYFSKPLSPIALENLMRSLLPLLPPRE